MELVSVNVYSVEGERDKYEVNLTITCMGQNKTEVMTAVVDTVAAVLGAST